MRILVISYILLALLLPGCGQDKIDLPVYSGSSALTYGDATAVSRIYCLQYYSDGTSIFSLGYERVEYDNGDALTRCQVADQTYRTASDSYYQSERNITDGSCSADFSSGSQWSFTLAGQTVTASNGSDSVVLSACSTAI